MCNSRGRGGVALLMVSGPTRVATIPSVTIRSMKIRWDAEQIATSATAVLRVLYSKVDSHHISTIMIASAAALVALCAV